MDDHKNEEQERNEEDFELTELELSLAEQISEELDGGKQEETAEEAKEKLVSADTIMGKDSCDQPFRTGDCTGVSSQCDVRSDCCRL